MPRHSENDLTLLPLILLHLLPGALITAWYIWVGRPLAATLGFPPRFAFQLKVLFATVPLELGWLLWVARRQGKPWSLDGVVRFRARLPAGRLAVYVLLLVGSALVVIRLLGFVDDELRDRFFFWLPVWLEPSLETSGYSLPVLLATIGMGVIVTGIVAPVVEELYFRGYLLPRMSYMGAWAPLVNTVLFNLYHFWSPWRFFTRTLFTLPMVYAVWKTRDIRIGIWWHCLGNILGELALLLLLLP